MRIARAAVAALFVLMPELALGQFEQYTVPGSLGLPVVSTRESIERSVGDAPWRLGAVRVQPWLGIRDIGYVENVSLTGDQTTVDDFTATAAFGIKAYLPMGPKVTLAAHFLPEYVWWQDTEELRGWHYQYGVGAFGYFNRLTVEARATSNDLQRYLSAEVEAPVTVRSRGADVLFDVDIGGPFSFFGGGTYHDFEHDEEGFDIGFETPLERLDRKEQTTRAGVKYNRQEWTLGLGAEWAETTFDDPQRDRSNSGFGPLLVLGYKGARWSADSTLAWRDLEAEDGSQFTRYEDFSGRAQLSYIGRNRVGGSVYAGQNLVYAIDRDAGYFRDERYGATLGVLFGWRTDLRFFVETGENDYVGFAGADNRRLDDVLSYGGNLQFKVLESSTLVLGYTRSEYDSNQDPNDRVIETLRIGLNVGGRLPW